MLEFEEKISLELAGSSTSHNLVKHRNSTSIYSNIQKIKLNSFKVFTNKSNGFYQKEDAVNEGIISKLD